MPTDLDHLLGQPVEIPPPDVEALWRRGRRRRTRLYALRGAVVLALTAGTALSLGFTFLGGASHAPTKVVSPPGTVAVPTVAATTAFVTEAGELVPINLATDQPGTPIAVPTSANLYGSPAAVVSPDGTVAYVLSLPTPTRAGVEETGPSLVPVNLATGRLGRPITFRATVVRQGAGAPTFAIAGTAITPDGKTVLIADAADNALIPIDVETGRSGRPIPLPSEPAVNSFILGVQETYVPSQVSPIGSIGITPDGETAYVTDGYAVIPVDLLRNRAERPITGFDDASSIAVAPDGKTAYVTNPYCWQSLSTDLCVKKPSHPIVEPNGRIQLGAAGDHVTVVDLQTNTIARELDVGKVAQPTGIAVAPDGSAIYVTYGQYSAMGGDVSVIDAETGKVLVQIKDGFPSDIGEGADAIAVTPDGTQAFVSHFVVGPGGPTALPGVVPVDLTADRAGPAIDLGSSVNAGAAFAGVVFGRS
jgi:DNA-binding beta-propeller fold protein YncE